MSFVTCSCLVKYLGPLWGRMLQGQRRGVTSQPPPPHFQFKSSSAVPVKANLWKVNSATLKGEKWRDKRTVNGGTFCKLRRLSVLCSHKTVVMSGLTGLCYFMMFRLQISSVANATRTDQELLFKNQSKFWSTDLFKQHSVMLTRTDEYKRCYSFRKSPVFDWLIDLQIPAST